MRKLKGTNVATKKSQKLVHQVTNQILKWYRFIFKQPVYIKQKKRQKNPNFLWLSNFCQRVYGFYLAQLRKHWRT